MIIKAPRVLALMVKTCTCTARQYLLNEASDEFGAAVRPGPGARFVVQGGGHYVVSERTFQKLLTTFVIIMR